MPDGPEEKPTMTVEELEAELLKLDPDARGRLAATLLRSLEGLSDAENERLWAEEAARRLAEIEAGVVEPRAGADVLRDIRSRLP